MLNKLIFILLFIITFDVSAQDSTLVLNNYFTEESVDFVYKTSINIKDNHLSGILYIKRIANDTVRVLMTGEMGNKMFDLTIFKKGYILNGCLPQLEKRILLKRLAFYFRTLTIPNRTSTLSAENTIELGRHSYKYIVTDTELKTIIVFKKIKKPLLEIYFLNNIQSIKIEDLKWNLELNLKKI